MELRGLLSYCSPNTYNIGLMISALEICRPPERLPLDNHSGSNLLHFNRRNSICYVELLVRAQTFDKYMKVSITDFGTLSYGLIIAKLQDGLED